MHAVTQTTVHRVRMTKLGRVSAVSAALLLVPALLQGCALFGGGSASTGTPRSGKVVTGGGRAEDEAEARAIGALAEARQAFGQGDALAALAAAGRGLRGNPPDHLDKELRAIRTQARDALLKEEVLRLSIVPARDAVADGEPLVVRIRVQNVAAAPVTIPASAKDSSNALVVLDVVREDRDIYGNVRETEFSLRVPLEEDMLLVPGESRDLQATIDGERTQLAHVGFSVLRIAGHLRPISVRVGATELYDALPLRPATVRVLMHGYEALTERPLDLLAEAIRKRSPPHIVTAAELLSPDERPLALQLLRDAAEHDPPLAFVLDATAERLAGPDAW